MKTHLCERTETSLARDGAEVAEDWAEEASDLHLSIRKAPEPTLLSAESSRVVVDDEAESLERVCEKREKAHPAHDVVSSVT